MKLAICSVPRFAVVAALSGAALLIAATPQVSLSEQELGNCDVDTAPFSQATPRAFVYDQENASTEGAIFRIDATHSAVTTINNYDGSGTPRILSGGKEWFLLFQRDATNNKFDVSVSEAGSALSSWNDTTSTGTYDPYGAYSAGFEEEDHPYDSGKECIRIWFEMRGLRGGFLMYDT